MNQESLQESIDILARYEHKTSSIKSGAGYYYIIWGLLLTSYYFLLFLTTSGFIQPKIAQFAWLLFPIGGIISMIAARKLDSSERILPLQDRIHAFIWIGIALALFMGILQSGFKLKGFMFESGLMISVATFITGGIFRFSAGIIAGMAGIFISAFIPFTEIPISALLTGCSLCVSLLIPGIIMVSKNNARV